MGAAATGFDGQHKLVRHISQVIRRDQLFIKEL
jgi:hypothetical protein